LNRFPVEEVAPIANYYIGRVKDKVNNLTESFFWFTGNEEMCDFLTLAKRLKKWREMNIFQVSELMHILHRCGPDNILSEISYDNDIYSMPGPKFSEVTYCTQAEIVVHALANRDFISLDLGSNGFDLSFLQVMRTLSCSKTMGEPFLYFLVILLKKIVKSKYLLEDFSIWPEFALLSRKLADRLEKIIDKNEERLSCIKLLKSWADMLENSYGKRKDGKIKQKTKSKAGQKKKPRRR
jgi:hypothetical protein